MNVFFLTSINIHDWIKKYFFGGMKKKTLLFYRPRALLVVPARVPKRLNNTVLSDMSPIHSHG